MAFTPPDRNLATRLARPARVFAARLGRFGRSAPVEKAVPERAEPPKPPVGQRKIAAHQALDMPLLPQAPEARATAQIAEDYARMAHAGQWEALSAALLVADRTRAVAPDGGRVAAVITKAAGQVIQAAMAQGDLPTAEAELAQMAAALGPEGLVHPGAAILLAQGHLTMAEGLGTGRYPAEDAVNLARLVQQHRVAAETLIERFDPIEQDLPQLAALRYGQVRGLAAAKDLCRDWYEDWSDLDPGAVEPHLEHACHLLPDWFGQLADFDAEARAAMERTRHASGAAAYALLHLTAAEEMGRLLPGFDAVLFTKGLTDYCRQTGCQFRANRIAGALTELAHDHEATPGPLTTALYDHLRQGGLREIHLSAFEGGVQALDWALNRVFGAELLRGARLIVTPEGIGAAFPEGREGG